MLPISLAARIAVAAALVALAAPVSAQSHLADSSGVYLGLTDLSLAVFSSGNLYSELGGVMGYRQANGLDYELGVRFGLSERYSNIEITPQIGYTHRLGKRSFARAQGALDYTQSHYTSNPSAFEPEGADQGALSFSQSRLAATASAGLGREIPLVGSFKTQPSLGLFGRAERTLDFDARGYREDVALPTPGDMNYSAGVYAEVPLSFRLFGKDVSVSSSLGIPIVGTRYERFTPIANGGVRVNF